MLALLWVVAASAQPLTPVFQSVTVSNLFQGRASTTGGASLNLPQGVQPTTPNNGDVWTTTAGMFAEINGVPIGPFGAGGSANNGSSGQLAYYASTGTTVSGLATGNNGVLVTGGSGIPSISMTLPSGLTIPGATILIATIPTSASLPTVTSANAGQLVFVLNCLNGTQTGINGTGCYYGVNNVGTWVPLPFVSTQTITVGGQALNLGQSSVTQGNGTAIATANGSFTNGDCVSINAGGAFVDAGGACTTGGGGGTVASGTIHGVAVYTGTTTVGSTSAVNNAVLATSGSGVPSLVTTLPSALTLPTATISNPAITGTGTYVALTGSGKLTTAASATGTAGFSLPPGTAPTSPSNGDLWSTNAGAFIRVNGATVPLGAGTGTVTSVATTAPIQGGTITTTGTITCPTCALTTNGGALTGTSPMAISAAGAISCVTCVTTTGGGALTSTSPIGVTVGGLISCTTCLVSGSGGTLVATSPLGITGSTISITSQTGSAVFNWDSNTNVSNQVYYITTKWPWATGSVSSVTYETGGTSTPSFVIGVQINGSNVSTCNGITVNSGTLTTTSCGTNAIASGNAVTLVVSSASGVPNVAAVQVNYSRSAI